jgi:hypothetical protein
MGRMSETVPSEGIPLRSLTIDDAYKACAVRQRQSCGIVEFLDKELAMRSSFCPERLQVNAAG